MKLLPITTVAAATLLFGFVASDARAAFSGSTRRTACPATVIAPTFQNALAGLNWSAITNQCGVKVSGAPSGQYSFATLAVPYESTNSQNVTLKTVVHATNSTGGSHFGMEAYSFDSSGNLSSWSANPPSNGTTLTQQTMSVTVTVPANGAVVLNVAGQNNAQIDYFEMVWTANGT